MAPLGSYLLLILLGLIPSLVWLGYWLRKDCHPEPKVLVTKVLLFGIIVSPLAIAAQLLFVQAAADLTGLTTQVVGDSPWFYLWASFVEEAVKWLVVALIVLRSPAFDEPVDAMVYMLTAALGFAAMENILALNKAAAIDLTSALSLWGLRFAGATLLHALSSALLGYFIALSWFVWELRRTFFAIGLVLATLFHWVFNLFVSQMHHSVSLLFSTLLLIAMAFLISVLFDKIKGRDSLVRANVC
jgi:RsiW-degrading membrane proteinase PrsW (M82 family)